MSIVLTPIARKPKLGFSIDSIVGGNTNKRDELERSTGIRDRRSPGCNCGSPPGKPSNMSPPPVVTHPALLPTNAAAAATVYTCRMNPALPPSAAAAAAAAGLAHFPTGFPPESLPLPPQFQLQHPDAAAAAVLMENYLRPQIHRDTYPLYPWLFPRGKHGFLPFILQIS